MRDIWRRAGLSRWSELLDGFVRRFLDSDCVLARNDKGDKNSDNLLDIILKGGNFGVYSKDRAHASRNVLSRKAHTLKSFVGNMRFALAYAPGEWFWTAAQLMGGQLR